MKISILLHSSQSEEQENLQEQCALWTVLKGPLGPEMTVHNPRGAYRIH